MSISFKILISRFLTRSGDQAWDFAVPLLLITLFPDNLRLAFIYFFTLRLTSMFLMPYLGKFIDEVRRLTIIKCALLTQSFSVLCTGLLLFVHTYGETLGLNMSFFSFYGLLLIFGITSNLGVNVMDIAVANDLVPTVIDKKHLARFNSKLRRVDLMTEVFSPICAGLLLTLSSVHNPLLGIGLIIGWNLISFIPELLILIGIIGNDPLLDDPKTITLPTSESLYTKFIKGWGVFQRSNVYWVIIANACLWITVLSPHGVLLTAFLKGGWEIPEYIIGLFRASGAVFGLIATFLYPLIHQRFGLILTGKIFILYQGLMVFLAFIFSFSMEEAYQYLFMIFILFSRIGLYGFGLAETELRQIRIPAGERGRINGVSQAMTSFATVLVYGLGIFFSTPESFIFLVGFSALSVVIGGLIYKSKV